MTDSIVLNTNAYVAFIKGEKWVQANITSAPVIYMPFVVLGELHYGFYNGTKAQENLRVLADFLSTPRVKVLQPTENTPRLFGEVSAELAQKGKPMQTNDIWIAALCKEANYTLLTADKGFNNIAGIKIISM